jgi:galactokinase
MGYLIASMGRTMMDQRGAPTLRDPAMPDRLAAVLPADARVLGRAPARANLIGEHTDYNDGFVLPVALEMQTVVAGVPASSIRLRSLEEPGAVEVDLGTGEGPTSGWGRYVTAVVRVLLEDGLRLRGLDGVVASDVPVGTGLSSSAALELSVALAILDEPVDAVRLAQLCQRAENVHVGVRSGIMDQLASGGARAGHALFIDCRSLAIEHVRVPDGLAIAVVDSGQRRELAGGEYNRRREECEQAARTLGVDSLRDVDDVARVEALPEPYRSRARHVVGENARTLATVDALRADDRDALASLFAASHASLATDYAVSTPDLDTLVATANDVDGVVAARMTGAGFGGCTVNVVELDRAEAAAAQIARDYAKRTDRSPRWWVSRAGPGALELLESVTAAGGS